MFMRYRFCPLRCVSGQGCAMSATHVGCRAVVLMVLMSCKRRPIPDTTSDNVVTVALDTLNTSWDKALAPQGHRDSCGSARSDRSTPLLAGRAWRARPARCPLCASA